MIESYDGRHPVNEISVYDERGDEVALWHDGDLRTRLAAHDLLDADQLALRELRGFYSDGESEAVRLLAAAIARATGRQPCSPASGADGSITGGQSSRTEP
jgi:hypothetical protein